MNALALPACCSCNACAQKFASSCYRVYVNLQCRTESADFTTNYLPCAPGHTVTVCFQVHPRKQLCHFTGCTEAAVGGTLTDIAAAQGTLTDLHTKAETGNEVTEIDTEADLVTDDFLR